MLTSHVDGTRVRWSCPRQGGRTGDARGTTDTRLPAAEMVGTGLRSRRVERGGDGSIPCPRRWPSGPRTQRRILRSSAAHPEFRGRPRRLPGSRQPQEAGTVGAPEAQVTPKPSGVEAAPPGLRTRASVVLFSAPAISAPCSQE
ncbi:hypothetical protein R6Z07F_000799 [Ovis aries]